MGHEFTGIVDDVGSEVKKFKKGDKIVSPFTTSWYETLTKWLIIFVDTSHSGECFYCKNGYSSRCTKCLLYGTAGLDGCQAEYVHDALATAI